MLVVTTWLWGSKYSQDDVRKLHAGVSRYLKEEHRFFVASPSGEDEHLTNIPGCFCRLRMFDPEWQKEMEVQEGDRVVCMDLDIVITGPLDPLFCRPESFMILQGANAANPCPFNGSLMMLRAGAHPEIWSDFDPALELSWSKGGHLSNERPFYYEFPDDQGHLAHKLPNAGGWKVGSQSGVYAFQKPAWPKGDDLPSDARMVVFPGWRSPEKFKHLDWVKENWV